MFNANHEDFDENITTYYGPHHSIMDPYARSNAFAFSKKNQENIVNYLNQFD